MGCGTVYLDGVHYGDSALLPWTESTESPISEFHLSMGKTVA
jgi:hypothetical protein